MSTEADIVARIFEPGHIIIVHIFVGKIKH